MHDHHRTNYINPKYHGQPLTQNINLDLIDPERLDRAKRNKEECDRKRSKTSSDDHVSGIQPPPS